MFPVFLWSLLSIYDNIFMTNQSTIKIWRKTVNIRNLITINDFINPFKQSISRLTSGGAHTPQYLSQRRTYNFCEQIVILMVFYQIMTFCKTPLQSSAIIPPSTLEWGLAYLRTSSFCTSVHPVQTR